MLQRRFMPPEKRVDPLVGAVDEADEVEHHVDPHREGGPCQALEPPEEAEVLAGGQVGIQRDVLGHQADGALGVRSTTA